MGDHGLPIPHRRFVFLVKFSAIFMFCFFFFVAMAMLNHVGVREGIIHWRMMLPPIEGLIVHCLLYRCVVKLLNAFSYIFMILGACFVC